MKEHPILFSGPMVRAILDGNKTQTRRIVKPQWPADVDEVSERPALDRVLKCVVSGHSGEWEDGHGLDEVRRCPYGPPGDRLWVRETFFDTYAAIGEPRFGAAPRYIYRADYDYRESQRSVIGAHHWKPSIFCTRNASRITLEIVSVRVERLQEMEGQAPYPGESDALAEGVFAIHHGDGEYYYSAFKSEPDGSNWIDPTDAYRELWETINGVGSWKANPWVWVIEFRRLPAGVEA